MSNGQLTPKLAVSTAMIRRYLRRRGWQIVEQPVALEEGDFNPDFLNLLKKRATGHRNFELYVLRESGSDDIELVLPTNKTAPDYERGIRGVLRTLSEVEGRDSAELMLSLRSSVFDLIQSRVPDKLVQEDSIHLVSAANYISGIKSLLAATATTELAPVAYFARARKDAIEYADDCRFGHTFPGSFGFTIESPVEPYNDELDLFGQPPPPPFERRVVERLATGIKQVCDAIEVDNVEILVAGVSKGFGSNGCDQFADLIKGTAHSGMTFSFTFSSEWPIPNEIQQNREFWVGPQHVEITRTAAELMRERISFPAKVLGRIVELQNETDPSDIFNTTGEHEILIDWSSDLYGEMRVRVGLTPSDYLSAVEAHATGRLVQIDGIIKRKGRRWILTDPTGFRILNNPGLPLRND